jgi:integration host factor subunit alpha
MTLTKNHIISTLHSQLELPKTRSTELVESLLEIIKKSLENGEDVLISGFGKFSVKGKNERRGRNPQTGADLVLGSRRVVTFRCSPVLRERINKEG